MAEISLDPILTDAGLAALRNADATGIAAKITHVALGDIGATPIQAMQTLQNERLRVACFSGGITGNKQITITANAEAGTPEFFVREIGFFLEDGTLFAFWSHPDQALGYRSQTTPWFFKFVFSWNAAGSVDVVFDTTAVLSCVVQDMAVLDAKIRHMIESESITPNDADNTQLTTAIEAKILLHKKLPVVSIAPTSGSITLETNTIYKAVLNGTTTFVLPTTVDVAEHQQIKLFLRITGTISVNWGTVNFINGIAPDVSAGDYIVYFDYSPNKAAWTCGAMIDGTA